MIIHLTIQGPDIFIIYINGLASELTSSAKRFTDILRRSFLSSVNESAISPDNDLHKISNRVMQQKMSFDPDPTKKI